MSSSTGKKKKVKLMEGQTVQFRQQLRTQQRKLGEEIAADAEAIGQWDSDAFATARAKSNELFGHTAYIRESALDAENMKRLVSATAKQSHAMALKVQKVTPAKIITGLRRKWIDDEQAGGFDWTAFGKQAGCLVNAVPHTEFLCGAVEKQEVKRARKEREKHSMEDVVATQPENVVGKDETVVESTEKRIKEFSKRFTEYTHEPEQARSKFVDAFQFVVQPDSFTQTVENIFDLSFLIKQGQAQMEIDEDGLPVIRQVMPENSGSFDQLQSNQLVISLSPGDMAQVAEAFQCSGDGIKMRDDPSYQADFLGVPLGSSSTATAAAASSASSSSASSSSSRTGGKSSRRRQEQ